MWPFKSKKIEERELRATELLLQAFLTADEITKEKALNIPAVSACTDIISKLVATLPIKLYSENDGRVKEIVDYRTRLLNDETGDTLDAFQFKKAIVEDYLLMGNGYAYINRNRNKIKSIHYVKENNVVPFGNVDPIFKKYELHVNGTKYRDYEFLKITRKTVDGITGIGIIEENNSMLAVAYNALKYENILLKTGGNKKGFIKSQNKLSAEAIAQLKEQWDNMYTNNTENCVVLNNGLDFIEAQSTSVELQLNENKKTNSNEICKLFSMPPSILDGTATDTVWNNFIKTTIIPVLSAIETALNKDLLLDSEKGNYYFAFDTKELLKGDIEKRFNAYSLAIKSGFMQIDEVRYREDLEPLELDFIKLGLQDVLYNPKTKEIYTPNTNKTTNITNPDITMEGGDNNEDRNTR